MSGNSKIEWTDATWNPVRGCTKLTPGCKNCYAKLFAERFVGVPNHPYEQGFKLRLVPERLEDPLKWKKPRKIFVNSMSDLFHPQVPDEYIVRVAEVMKAAHWHTFQVLTKRADRMSDLLQRLLKPYSQLMNVWWGVSVENRKHGLPRIGALRKSGAANTFLSVEPLLEDLGKFDLSGIAWVIVGGESGPHARPIEAGWVRSIRSQCALMSIPFFFKQWGGKRKHLTGRILDGVTHDDLPSTHHHREHFLILDNDRSLLESRAV